VSVEEAAGLLAAARRVFVVTGAGMSAESGIPTFRDALTGLWSGCDPMTLASPDGFEANPELVWRWYASRRERVLAAQPNAGHLALVRLEGRYEDLMIATQNVDGLHGRAGSRRVLELHGNILESRCFREGRRLEERELDASRVPPSCPCGSHARPGVVWFGEALPDGVLGEAAAAVARCDVCLVVGTSGVVQPAASLPIWGRAAGAKIIEINREESEITLAAHVVLRGSAATVLPSLVDRIAAVRNASEAS